MPRSIIETALVTQPGERPRKEALLPPAIIMLVFAMVVIAIGGFAFIGGEQSALSTLRARADAMQQASTVLSRTEASAARVLGGDRTAIAEFLRNTDELNALRPATFDTIGGITPQLDTLLADWSDATGLAVAGDVQAGGALLVARNSDVALDMVADAAVNAAATARTALVQHEQRSQFLTLLVLLLQVLSGTLAITALFFAFRSSAREAQGRSAALRSADNSRGQVARLFEMADVLQSASDYGDANQVLKATAADLLPGFGGALYVFNNSRDRLVLSTSWGSEGDAPPHETIPPDQCWALKRGKPHVNHRAESRLCCEHHHGTDTVLEIPMIARGEIMGLFQLSAGGDDAEARLDGVTGLASAIADGMSLALANMGLREKLRNQALRDPLTGLYNRRYMEDCLQRFVRLAERENREVSVVMVDLDHFKHLNDEHGHAFGDAVLRDTAIAIVGSLRETDIVCRYGGEELVVILPDCNLDRAADKAEMLRLRIEALSKTHGAAISASFGVAAVPYTSSSVTDLVAAADGALYRAKQSGRNQVSTAPTRPFHLDRLEDAFERADRPERLEAAE
jgi:diguanylate cyclase (GGDEF)-like protein